MKCVSVIFVPILLALGCHGQLRTYTVAPKVSKISANEQKTPKFDIETSAFGDSDSNQIEPTPAKIPEELAKTTVTTVKSVSTTESVILLLDRIRNLPPGSNNLWQFSSTTTESVIELLNDLRERVSSKSVSYFPQNSTSTTNSPQTTEQKSEEMNGIAEMTENPIKTLKTASILTKSLPNKEKFHEPENVNTPEATTEPEKEEIETTTTFSATEFTPAEEIIETTLFEEIPEDTTLNYEITPDESNGTIHEALNTETTVRNVVLEEETTISHEIDEEISNFEDTTTISDISTVKISENFLETATEMEKLVKSEKNDTKMEQSTRKSETETIPPDYDVPFHPIPSLVKHMDGTNNTMISKPAPDWRPIVIATLVTAMFLALLIFGIIYFVLHYHVNKKNIYTTMNAKPPPPFTNPGPPVILQHEIEAGKYRRAMFSANTQKVTEL